MPPTCPYWLAGFTNLQLLKSFVAMHCMSFFSLLFTEPQQHFTPASSPPTLAVSLIGVFVSFMVKFETRASQVQQVCLHATHSSVVETLIMHRSFKMDKCLKKEMEKQ